MSKVVVIIENGVVQNVITNSADVTVLVLDRDTGGTDSDGTMQDILGDVAAKDTVRQGAAQLDPERTLQAFNDLRRASPEIATWLDRW